MVCALNDAIRARVEIPNLPKATRIALWSIESKACFQSKSKKMWCIV